MGPWTPPAAFDAWYLVAGADELPRGALRPFELGSVRGVLARGADGRPFALRATCPHMGADLRLGRVVDGRVVCPLHALPFGADGRCGRPGVPPAAPLPVAEACGALFVHPGLPVGPPPVPDRFSGLRFVPARSERVPVPWGSVLINAFDLHHLRAVHHRALDGEAVFDHPSPDRLRLRYRTRVVGDRPVDRLVRALGGGRVDLHLTNVGGPVMIVEAELGRTRSVAVVGVVPDGDHTFLRLSVGVPDGSGWRLRARVARRLYTRFLHQDVPVLRGVVLSPASPLPEDAAVQRLVAFLETRPTP